MKVIPVLFGVGGLLLLGANCAQPTKKVSTDAGASRKEAMRRYEQWKVEQESLQKIADQEEEKRKRYFAEYFREHGYPTQEDRERAIREALKRAPQRAAPAAGPGQTQYYSKGKH